MSIVASYKTTIRLPKTQLEARQGNIKETPCFDILRLAMKKVIKDRGGKIDSTYTDNEGKNRECLISARTAGFRRGVGATVEKDGRLTFLYDSYGDSRAIAGDICDEINHNYNVIAVMRAQKKLGFNVRIEDEKSNSKGKITTLTGVR